MSKLTKILLGVGLASAVGISAYSYSIVPKPKTILRQSVEIRDYETFTEIEQNKYEFRQDVGETKTHEFKRVFKDPCQEQVATNNVIRKESSTNYTDLNGKDYDKRLPYFKRGY